MYSRFTAAAVAAADAAMVTVAYRHQAVGHWVCSCYYRGPLDSVSHTVPCCVYVPLDVPDPSPCCRCCVCYLLNGAMGWLFCSPRLGAVCLALQGAAPARKAVGEEGCTLFFALCIMVGLARLFSFIGRSGLGVAGGGWCGNVCRHLRASGFPDQVLPLPLPLPPRAPCCRRSWSPA